MSYEEKEMKDFSIPKPSISKFPHGMKISLGKEEMKKLNLEGKPEIGKKFNAEIMVEVIEISKVDDDESGSDDYRVELQIKEMELKKDKTDDVIKKSDSAQILYGE